jgi:hypothetical protein
MGFPRYRSRITMIAMKVSPMIAPVMLGRGPELVVHDETIGTTRTTKVLVWRWKTSFKIGIVVVLPSQ